MATDWAEEVNRWRIIPRILMLVYALAMYRCTDWFMALPDPSMAQSTFVSVVYGAGAGFFGIYVGGKRDVREDYWAARSGLGRFDRYGMDGLQGRSGFYSSPMGARPDYEGTAAYQGTGPIHPGPSLVD